jgi:ribosomal protein S18 acetylase RimI-like enzyme
MADSLGLRPLAPGDGAFWYTVYASTRADEMALVPWTADQKEAFLQMQFNAQQQYYLEEYATAEYHVIQRDRVAIGRLIVDRQPDNILLMDIALLPEYRNDGVGTALVQDLMAEAAQAGKPLRLHVETFNRALRWYERLGFVKVREIGVYYEMEWRSEKAARAEVAAG